MSESDVRFTKDIFEALLRSQNQSQADAQNALIRGMQVAANLVRDNGGKKKTHRNRKSISRGPYNNQEPTNPPGRRARKRERRKRDAQDESEQTQVGGASGINTTNTINAESQLNPMIDADIIELSNLEHLFSIPPKSTEATSDAQEPPVPAYTPANISIPPILPTPIAPNPEAERKNPSTTQGNIGALPTATHPEETVDYEEDYAMEETEGH
ncbi:hypothetical protein BN14_12378 [Rhizoctonia solani AG-1 IB]|uniref:Uncharacterized protein n=1 Tax=Thanatephorus cucumeris (strain AG1-IB / isolate 7/3/14) TaxID=1108050 RepID=M5CFF9_THACB|nr:hypothetical protein BN14_12378 [Rhizoctonia solani AG-1 IB]